jgi:general stress protein CsbA
LHQTMHKLTTINKYIVLSLSLVLLISCKQTKSQKANGLVQSKVEVYKVGNGWAYSIFLGEKEYIRQSFIPAIQEKIPFATDSQAMAAGKLVLSKMAAHKNPALTKEELEQYHLLPAKGNIQSQ